MKFRAENSNDIIYGCCVSPGSLSVDGSFNSIKSVVRNLGPNHPDTIDFIQQTNFQKLTIKDKISRVSRSLLLSDNSLSVCAISAKPVREY